MKEYEGFIPTLEQFTEYFPEEFLTDQVKERLQNALTRVTEMIEGTVKYLESQGKPFKKAINQLPATPSGSQFIADFGVWDLSKPKRDEYNWHAQNVSQVALNGCILFDSRMFAKGSEHCVNIHT